MWNGVAGGGGSSWGLTCSKAGTRLELMGIGLERHPLLRVPTPHCSPIAGAIKGLTETQQPPAKCEG